MNYQIQHCDDSSQGFLAFLSLKLVNEVNEKELRKHKWYENLTRHSLLFVPCCC